MSASSPLAAYRRTLAELFAYCEGLPDTDAGRHERAVALLGFDTGLTRWQLSTIRLSDVDLDAGLLPFGDCDYCLSQFALDAVAAWRKGGAHV